MIEAEWLSCTDPAPMLEYLRHKASDRKLRLFACACTRAIWDLLDDDRARQAVEVAERYADGLATERELSDAAEKAWEAVDACPAEANYAARATVEGDNYTAAEDAARHASLEACATGTLNAQSALLRDIFGNPFRLATLHPSWRVPEVVSLAQVIYERREFVQMPRLVDALTKAGCSDADILAHCDQPIVHVPGCWVVDLILGETQIRMPGCPDLGQRRRHRNLFPKIPG
jgi:hypothetical protein